MKKTAHSGHMNHGCERKQLESTGDERDSRSYSESEDGIGDSIGNLQLGEAHIIVCQLKRLFATMVFCESIEAHWILYSGKVEWSTNLDAQSCRITAYILQSKVFDLE